MQWVIPMNKVSPWDWKVAQLAKLALMYDKPGETAGILNRAKGVAELYQISMIYFASLLPIVIGVLVFAEIPGNGLVSRLLPLLYVAWIVYVAFQLVKACRKVMEARYIYATIDQGGHILEHGCLRGSRPPPNRGAWELFRDYWKMGL